MIGSRKPLLTFAIANVFAFGLAACDSGTSNEEPKPNVVAKGEDAPKGDDAKAGGEEKPDGEADAKANAEADANAEGGEDSADAAGDVDPRVAKAAAVAKDIEADPEQADDVLAKHELDREKLDALMYEIAKDPDLSKAYQAERAG